MSPVGISDVLERLEGVKRSGDGWTARCPTHDDSNPSLSVAEGADGRVLLHCFAGCRYEAIINALDFTPSDLSRSSRAGYSLKDYADEKGFSAEHLRAWGLSTVQVNNRSVVRIPCYDADGRELRARLRSGSEKWWEGRGLPIHLYGLDHLAKSDPDEPVLLVEGESDCHAAWTHGVLAVGVPGALAWKGEWREHFGGRAILAWQEPGPAGEKFVQSLAADFADLLVIRAPSGIKDLAELHLQAADSFRSNWDDLVLRAKSPEAIEVHPTWGGEPGREHLTDLGNARRFVRLHGDEVRYVKAWKQFLVWDGRRWIRDTTGNVERKAKSVVASIYSEAANCNDDERRRKIGRWARKSEADARLKAMVSLVKSEPGISVSPKVFDSDPWLINAPSGTIDLRSGDIRSHDPGDLITRITGAAYDPHASAPRWAQFLDEIFDSRSELVRYIQRFVGYSLTGIVREHVFHVFYGGGSNGKSVLLTILRWVLGDYALNTPIETFLRQRSSGIPNDVARLRGARFVTAVEMEGNRKLAEGLVKAMTGGDVLTGRFLYSEFFDFEPAFKPVIAVNERPVIEGTNHGIWRRIRLVPFEVTFGPGAGQRPADTALTEKLKNELPGILKWAVDGCRAWQAEELNPPSVVMAAVEEYRSDMDPVGLFVEEACVRTDPHSEDVQATAHAHLYAAYERWANGSGREVKAENVFGQRLNELEIPKDRKGPGRAVRRLGIRLADIDDLDPQSESDRIRRHDSIEPSSLEESLLSQEESNSSPAPIDTTDTTLSGSSTELEYEEVPNPPASVASSISEEGEETQDGQPLTDVGLRNTTHDVRPDPDRDPEAFERWAIQHEDDQPDDPPEIEKRGRAQERRLASDGNPEPLPF